jgi:hypothetical protein
MDLLDSYKEALNISYDCPYCYVTLNDLRQTIPTSAYTPITSEVIDDHIVEGLLIAPRRAGKTRYLIDKALSISSTQANRHILFLLFNSICIDPMRGYIDARIGRDEALQRQYRYSDSGVYYNTITGSEIILAGSEHISNSWRLAAGIRNNEELVVLVDEVYLISLQEFINEMNFIIGMDKRFRLIATGTPTTLSQNLGLGDRLVDNRSLPITFVPGLYDI